MNNSIYMVKANYLYLDGLVAKVADLVGFLPEMLSMEERAAALDIARFIIDAVESMDVIRDHVSPLCEANIVRGSILHDDTDIEAAFYYAILYRALVAVNPHEFLTVMHEIQSKQKLGSFLSLKVFEALGYLDILRH